MAHAGAALAIRPMLGGEKGLPGAVLVGPQAQGVVQDLLVMFAAFFETGAHLGRVPVAPRVAGLARRGRAALLGAGRGGHRHGETACEGGRRQGADDVGHDVSSERRADRPAPRQLMLPQCGAS